MTATTRWVIDTNWSAISFTAGDVNSLASGGGALGTTVVTNSSGLDMLMEASFVVTVGGTTVTSSTMILFVLPLNQDGSHYGDNYASSTTTQPSAGYGLASIGVLAGVTSGNAVYGSFPPVTIPPGDFKIAIGNSLAVALNSTASLTLKVRTFNVNLNA